MKPLWATERILGKQEQSQGNKRLHLLQALDFFFFFKLSSILTCLRRLFLPSSLCKALPLVLLIPLTLQQTEEGTHSEQKLLEYTDSGAHSTLNALDQ